jgi:hypothetical protein
MDMPHELMGHYGNDPVDLGNFTGIGGSDAPSYSVWRKANSKKKSLDTYNEWLKVDKKARIKKYGKAIYEKRNTK